MSSQFFQDKEFNASLVPVGTGMYKYTDVQSTYLTLEKNNNWWDTKTKLTITKVTVNLYSSLAELYNSFKMGSIDIIDTDNNNLQEYIGTIGYAKKEMKGREHIFLALNNTSNFLSRKEIRKAISYSIDKTNIASNIFNNQYFTSSFPLDYGSWIYQEQDASAGYNPDQAKKILIDGGWSYKSNYWQKIENYKKIDVNKEYTQAKKYWTNYLEKHDGLNLKENSNKIVNDRVKEIYKRTILLFPLLQNEETGGVSATVEIDENREKSGRYSYCWPRDAVFIAKAFDYLNMKKETDKFYENFCKKTQSKNGMWEQRFYTDGTLAPCWGYQIDETASVIYGVYEHYKNTKELKFLQSNMKMCENALHFLFKYLENIFGEKEEKDLVKKEIEEQVIKEGRQKDQIYKHVSYDLWEMNEGVHLYSLASIYGAFNAMIGMYEEIKPKYENNRLKLEKIAKDIQKIKDEIENIRKYVENNLYDENTKVLRRNTEDSKMDISTIGAVYPFELFGADEKKVLNTVEKINMTLRTYTGGYLRFEQDSYMGGKYPWPVTTLWMAMYYLKAGNKKMAQECFNFVVNSTSSLGFISEQVDNNTMKPSWAIGLGWSHAMFIITLAELLK